MEKTLIVMPGSTEGSFIDRFVSDWFANNPNPANYPEICQQLEGMARWHRIIGSTPPAWLTKALAVKINKFMVQHEAKTSPWFRNVVQRDMGVFKEAI
jgi:hypothetical protein